jgi:uroporphyrinogen-III synthase
LADLERSAVDFAPRLVAVEDNLRHGGPPPVAEAPTANVAQPPAIPSASLAPLVERVERLEAEAEALRRAMPAEGTVLHLAERVDAAEKAVRDIGAQHASAQALLLVIGQLRDAVDRGDPFPMELRAARRVAAPEDDAALTALSSGAESGIPRKDRLAAMFPSLADDILRAARADNQAGFWRRAVGRLSQVVSLRRIDGQGNGPEAVLGRAEAQLADGRLNEAVRQLAGLQGPAAEAATPWVGAAEQRLAADRALSELAASVAARTAQDGEPR